MVRRLRLSLLCSVAFLVRSATATTTTGLSPCVLEVLKLTGKNAAGAQVGLPSEAWIKISLASGKSIPYDAGKYVMCVDAPQTRFFLVEMTAIVPPLNVPKPLTTPMKMGLCVPDVCDHSGVFELVSTPYIGAYLPDIVRAHIQLTNITTTSSQLDLNTEAWAGIVAAVFVSLLIALVLFATYVTLMAEHPTNGDSSAQPLVDAESASERPPRGGMFEAMAKLTIIKAFTMFGKSGTLVKLVELPSYKPTDSLNGIRVISMFWIILGHTFLMPEGISGYQNNEDIIDNPLNSNTAEKSPWFQLILGAQAGVDTFFFLSGFLLAFLSLKEIRAGRFKVILGILLRYVRLTPSLGLVMLVYYKIWSFFGNGPFAVIFQRSINERCLGSWWSELLYTMNFVPFDSNKVCMGWTWYLGDDMWFFIITLILLPVYHKSKMAGWTFVLFTTFLSFAITTYLVVKYDLSVYVFDDHYKRYSFYAYSKPYTRIPAYFVGVMAAWILDELEQKGFTRQTRPRSRKAKCFAQVAAALALFVIFLMTLAPYWDFGSYKNNFSTFTNVIYINLSRPVFAAGFAVITILCYYDYLPLINAILAHPYWTPFARLTYGAYLIHPLVIKLSAGRSLQFYTFNGMDILYRFTGNSICAFGGSACLWVLCERPCMTIFAPKRPPPKARRPEGEDQVPSVMSSGSAPDVGASPRLMSLQAVPDSVPRSLSGSFNNQNVGDK